MNAINDLTKLGDKPTEPGPDGSPALTSGGTARVGVTKRRREPIPEALPDPITGVYGALRGLIDQSNGGIVVHVVAATQGEGASTIAKAIATTAAAAGSGRVLLMDGKLPSRKPISEHRPASADPKTTTDGNRLPSTNVTYGEGAGGGLFTGSISAAARNERVDPREVKEAYAAWRQEYDLVIVDCPPVASGRYIDLVPDAADWVVMVVQAEKLRPAVLQRVRETIEQQGGKILGVILNDARRYIPQFIYRLI